MNSLFGPESSQKEGEGKSHFLTLLSLGIAALTLWTRKEPLPLWISVLATGLLALGVLYVYFGALSRKIREVESRWRLCRSVNILKPRMLDYLTALDRFVDRDRGCSFIRLVEEINQLQAVRDRRLAVGDTAHLYTISRFGKVVRSQVMAVSRGSELRGAADSVYTVFSDYNFFVSQVHNRLQTVIQELSSAQTNPENRRHEDEAIRAIRTKWNSFRDLQNAFIQAGLQLGEEIQRQGVLVPWGSHIEHYQTLE